MTQPVDSLRDFIARHGRASEQELLPGVLVVGSGKGGAGTSTVSALLALAAASRGQQTLLVDGDENVPVLSLLLGASPGPGIGALRGGETAVADLVIEVDRNLSLVPGGDGGVASTYASAAGERRALFRRLSGLYDDFDLVIVDGGSRLESVVAACHAGAERLIVVTASDRIALASSHALMKVACARFPNLPLEVLVNGHDGPRARAVYQIVQSAAEHFLRASPRFAGGIAEDAGLRSAMTGGRLLNDAARGSQALVDAREIVERILAEQAASARTGASVVPLTRGG